MSRGAKGFVYSPCVCRHATTEHNRGNKGRLGRCFVEGCRCSQFSRDDILVDGEHYRDLQTLLIAVSELLGDVTNGRGVCCPDIRTVRRVRRLAKKASGEPEVKPASRRKRNGWVQRKRRGKRTANRRPIGSDFYRDGKRVGSVSPRPRGVWKAAVDGGTRFTFQRSLSEAAGWVEQRVGGVR